MKLIAVRKAEQNSAVVDPWTAVHFTTGLAMGLTNVPLRWGIVAALVYEIGEQFFERSRAGQELLETSGPESLPNAALDLAVFLLGHDLGRRWNDGRG